MYKWQFINLHAELMRQYPVTVTSLLRLPVGNIPDTPAAGHINYGAARKLEVSNGLPSSLLSTRTSNYLSHLPSAYYKSA
jgi:hypothetical protein